MKLGTILPDWYKGFFIYNRMGMHERPIEYVYYALKKRPFLLSIINDNFKFCLEDPKANMRKLIDCIEDI